jgi:Putative heavy-metal chelation
MISTYALARSWLSDHSFSRPPDDYTVRTAFSIDILAKPTDRDPLFVDTAILITTSGVGYVTAPTPVCLRQLGELIGSDVRKPRTNRDALEWACIDAGLSLHMPSPAIDLHLTGSPSRKAATRADLLVAELSMVAPTGSTVLLVGAVGSLISGMKSSGYDVLVCDLDDSLQGSDVAGCFVPRGGPEVAIDLLQQASAVVATGMTLVNNTADALVDGAHRLDIPFLVYAQSCTSIAAGLAAEGIVSTAITERWPNYFFPGDTHAQVFRGR